MVSFKTVQKIHKKLMYKDKCDIFKFEKQVNPNGSKSTIQTKVPVYADVPCKISFNDRIWDTFHHNAMDTTPYQKQPKIFMEVEYKIKPGYYFIATRFDEGTNEIIAQYEGQCGLPQVFLSHQELLLDTNGDD